MSGIEQRLQQLGERGVENVDPRQTWVGPEVDLERVHAGVVLHPGTRLSGARAYVGAGAVIGAHGPAVLVDAVLGAGARVQSGYLERAVLLRGAVAGANAHFRPGTLLEEEASTGHAVGLKQTILLSFVTLGSVINFCDVLMAGGTSRRDHSEVGSGFIHFNYTPWGAAGDKATASLIGDVARGVFLRERRIFLGGVSGMIGPRAVGYGSVAGAGQIVRRDVPADHLTSESPPRIRRELKRTRLDGAEPRGSKNVRFIAQLVALRAWYRAVRLERASEATAPVIEAGLENIDEAIAERVKRLGSFLAERGRAMPTLVLDAPAGPCPLSCEAGSDATVDHVAWVQALTPEQADAGVKWLDAIAASVAG